MDHSGLCTSDTLVPKIDFVEWARAAVHGINANMPVMLLTNNVDLYNSSLKFSFVIQVVSLQDFRQGS